MCPCLLHPAPGSKKTSLCGCGGGFSFLVYGNLESSHALPANGRREGRDDLANLATYRLFVFLAEFLLTVDWRGRGAKGDPLGRLDLRFSEVIPRGLAKRVKGSTDSSVEKLNAGNFDYQLGGFPTGMN